MTPGPAISGGVRLRERGASQPLCLQYPLSYWIIWGNDYCCTMLVVARSSANDLARCMISNGCNKAMTQLLSFEAWPEHMHPVFVAIGRAMGPVQLNPQQLADIPFGVGAILPEHDVRIKHVPGSAIGRRKGYYEIEIKGPRVDGRWVFASGELAAIARQAVAR
jgi:hypothetical protein